MKNLFNTTYLVIGFKNKNEWATLNKKFQTEAEARQFIDGVKANFEVIVLRKEEAFNGNNDGLDISTSTVIEKFVA